MATTNEKILEAVGKCAERIRVRYPRLEPAQIRDDFDPASVGQMGTIFAQHALYMTVEIPLLLAQGRREKVMRWLGFLQGFLWTDCYARLSELKAWNMPDESGDGLPTP